MYQYRLIEFNSAKKETQIISNKSKLKEVLAEFYKDKLYMIFNEDNSIKGYLSVFVNSKQIISIKEIVLNPNDKICIVTSISGG